MYSLGLAYVLWLLSGMGALGLHRFYLGKVGTGILFILTGGLGGIGSIFDLITLPAQVKQKNMELRLQKRRQKLLDVSGTDRPAAVLPGGKMTNPEIKVLETARKYKGFITASDLVVEAGFTVVDAERCLERLSSQGFAEVRVNDNGSVVYHFQDFDPDMRDGESI